LGPNGLFSTWFNANLSTGLSDMVMSYLVRCALPSTQSTSFKDSAGTVHSWTGNFGLAPEWFSGQPTTADAEWVSACLMALTNSNGNHITVSLRGNTSALATSAPERDTMVNFDGAFFGNLFNVSNQQKYACYGNGNINETVAYHYMGRGCAYQDSCNITQIGACSSYCTAAPTGSAYPWASCTYNGTTWTHPINVQLSTLIEGESPTSSSGVSTISSPTASNGEYEWVGGQATYTLPNVSTAGTYGLELWLFSGGSPHTFTLSVNGQAGTSYTGGRSGLNSLYKISAPVTLPAGVNTVTVVNQGGSGLDLDLLALHP
jgi:hypothetical protein